MTHVRLSAIRIVFASCLAFGACEAVQPIDAEVSCPAGSDCTIVVPPVTVFVPAAAIPAAGLDLTISSSTTAPTAPSLVPGSAWDIEPSGATFTPPAQVTVDYSGIALASVPGVLPRELGIYKVATGQWQLVPGSAVDTLAKTLKASISSLSTYGILGAPVATVTVTPAKDTLSPGATSQLTASVRDGSGTVLPQRTTTWASQASAVATVSGTGLVTAQGVGVTNIIATSEGVSGTAEITVVAGSPAVANFLVEAAGGGPIGTQTAGVPFNIRVTARDAGNNTVTSFTGTVNITSTGTLSAGGGTTAAFVNGVLASHSVTFRNTGSFTLTATRTGGTETGTSSSFTVNPGPLASFAVEAAGGGPIGTRAVNTPFNIRVTARDANNNTATAFTGTVNITSTGTLGAGGGTTAAFTAGVLASHSVTITNTGTFTITATRTGGTETGTSAPFTVATSASNEPPGMTPLLLVNGTTKDWGPAIDSYGGSWGDPTEGTGIPGVGTNGSFTRTTGAWSNDALAAQRITITDDAGNVVLRTIGVSNTTGTVFFSGNATGGTKVFTRNVSVVLDNGAPNGKAVQVDFWTGQGDGFAGAAFINGFSASYREFYIRTVFKYSANWQQHPSGTTKLFYYGITPQPTEFYPQGNGSEWTIRWRDQGGNDDDGVFVHPTTFPPGVYHTLEIHHVMESSDGANDGYVRIWLDGVELRDSWNNLTAGQKNGQLHTPQWSWENGGRLNGAQLGTFWGGTGGTKSQDDWMRWGEIYISGKP